MKDNILEIKNIIKSAEKKVSRRISKKPEHNSFSQLFFEKIEQKYKKSQNNTNKT